MEGLAGLEDQEKVREKEALKAAAANKSPMAWEAGVVWGEVSAGEMRDFGERSEGRSGGVRGLHGSLALRLKDVCQWKDPG